MARYINKYANAAAIQDAIDAEELSKPYVAYDIAEDKIDWNSKEPAPSDYSKIILTFEVISAGTIVWGAQTTASTKTIQYKKNDGEWTSITSNTGSSMPSIDVLAGDIIQFKGNNATYCNGMNQRNFFAVTTPNTYFKVYGNIMSLVYGDNFINQTTLTSARTFSQLFFSTQGSTGLTDAGNLVLPATTLTEMCYTGMFESCSHLTAGPSILPATTLVTGCYSNMFKGCNRLSTAPALPATTLVTACYSYLFNGCSKINYVKCLATNPDSSYTSYWLGSAAATGTFVKKSGVTWPSGTSGIPNNWTVEEE